MTFGAVGCGREAEKKPKVEARWRAENGVTNHARGGCMTRGSWNLNFVPFIYRNHTLQAPVSNAL